MMRGDGELEMHLKKEVVVMMGKTQNQIISE